MAKFLQVRRRVDTSAATKLALVSPGNVDRIAKLRQLFHLGRRQGYLHITPCVARHIALESHKAQIAADEEIALAIRPKWLFR